MPEQPDEPQADAPPATRRPPSGGVAALVERLRAAVRRDETGVDDDFQGAVADPEPAASVDYPTSLPAQPSQAIDPARAPTVPWGVELVAGWSWRFLVTAGAVYVIFLLLRFFSEITIPLAIAVLITALASPGVDLLVRLKVPRGLAAGLTVIVGLAFVVGMLTLVGTQVSGQVDQLRKSVVDGLSQVQDWLKTGPLHLSDAQLASMIDQIKHTVETGNSNLASTAAEIGTTLTHVLAGLFIVLFSVFFFCYEGHRIWSWLVQLFPRAARERIDTSGRVAWVSLTAFVRATVLVALTDALGISLAATVLGVPLALAIGVLVFFGAFVPVIGAFLSGTVAVLVALVAQGWVVALVMLGAVVLVQQIESHVLQPFLMGRLVSLHPLAVILSIAGGVVVAGLIGALIAVPSAACVNAVVKHLSGRDVPMIRRRVEQ
ncbi:MAG: AI-2E family transporter [Nocardioidaceae bacterium]